MSGERLVEWWEQVAISPEPVNLAAHLESGHRMPVDVIEDASPAELRQWHGAEHRTRHPGKGKPMHVGHLTHTHPPFLPTDHPQHPAFRPGASR